MAFKAKTTHYDLGTVSNAVLVSVTENRSASTVEARGDDGFIVASFVFGEKSAPSEEYVIKGDVALTGIKMGSVKAVGGDSFALESITVTTSAGAAPTMSVAGQQVEDGAASGCTVTLPAIPVSGLHHAQTFGQFTVGGQGAHLTQSTLTISGTISTAEKDGETIAFDLTDCRMAISGTIQVSDAAYGIPTVTPQTGWVLTSPITETNPDSNYPTYSFTLTKFFAADED